MSASNTGERIDVVHRNIEEALNLVGMQIDGEHAVNTPTGGQHVGNDFGGDGHARGAYTTVLTGITKVGDHCGDAAGAEARRRASAMTIISIRLSLVGAAGGLQDENILAAHVVIDLNCNFAVREAAHKCIPERDVQMGGRLCGPVRDWHCR
jgi:hypothetical protein